MKSKQLKSITIILVITISFFLGRETKNVNLYNNTPSNFNSDSYYPSSVENIDVFNDSLKLTEKISDTVFRCGKSKIYHPTLSHASFKKCKSKVTKLTVKKAKNIGMRHCKCSK